MKQKINQNVQDCCSDLVPKNPCLVWEKDTGVEVRSKDDTHGTFSSSSLENEERMAQLPLGLGLEPTQDCSEKQQDRDEGAKGLGLHCEGECTRKGLEG